MSAAPARYRFDLDLGHREERSQLMTDSAIAEAAKAARLEGFAEGYAEGEAGVLANSGRKLSAAADALADRAAAMLAALEKAKQTANSDAADLALSVGRKLAHHLLADQPAVEVQALIADCLASLEGIPHLVIRCHPDLADAIREGTEARIAVSGFTGRLVVIGDTELAPSDGRIEWADGGLVRDTAKIEAQIDAAIGAFVGKRNTPPAGVKEVTQ